MTAAAVAMKGFCSAPSQKRELSTSILWFIILCRKYTVCLIDGSRNGRTSNSWRFPLKRQQTLTRSLCLMSAWKFAVECFQISYSVRMSDTRVSGLLGFFPHENWFRTKLILFCFSNSKWKEHRVPQKAQILKTQVTCLIDYENIGEKSSVAV